MTVTVEANSLSDITQIASNPPRYPRNPAEKPRRPLTLYIARVPGSKAIFNPKEPVPGSEPSTSIQPSSQTDQTIPRHPLGPRSISSVSNIERKPVPGACTQNPELTQIKSNPHNLQYQKHEFLESNPSSVLRDKNSERAFSVTIIRRDLSSGAQWNIGTVFGHPLTEEGSNGRNEKSSNPNETSQQETSSTFDRRITMEGSSFWDRASAQRKRAISDLSDKYRTSCGLRAHENDHCQHDVKAHGKGYVFMSPWGGRCKFVTGSGGRSLRCHHKLPPPISANSMDIQQHSVTVSELRFNLPISLLAYSTAPQSIDRKGDIFSESHYKDVRSKMKILKLTGPPLTHRTRSNSGFNHRSDDEGHLARTYSRTSTDSRENNYFETTETSRNSLELLHQNYREEDTSNKYHDLGREKAGGGSNGTHAKLGKIIIHDEGIKMLDLIVSANMAIWWSVWDGF
ncbi:hypothetical protein EPUL_003952 [Erysiphe pulchra]|uniref:Uncharacterized protein n=1 Tax=Erysiphe pulchra TaxID=225359 RepID=A0A2S4PTR2_9PEZI|nr:hypothetical protein EPUL_003952 [Erysiphe pulchra]